ncbi:MAG TPA: hypothetical protein VL651_15335 [Bacteroidia bacterium]|jgi:hypothetical protein|nr:hypothetical protein [Bacteroidia bacterium]
MKSKLKNKDHEYETRLTMESLDNIGKAELPANLENDFLRRLDRIQKEDRSRLRWFWAAAVVILLVNGSVALNYLFRNDNSSSSVSTAQTNSSSSPKESFTNYYYGNSSSWYQ